MSRRETRLGACIATRAAIYRSLRALRARNRKKVSKRVFFWGSGEKSQKIPEKVFLDFFAISGREGPETPVNGGSGRNACTPKMVLNNMLKTTPIPKRNGSYGIKVGARVT